MKTTAVPLNHLAQRIAEQQSELENLRQEYEARQARLADLDSRKNALEAQLRQIEAEIQAVARGTKPLSAPRPTPTPATSATPPTLAEFLQELVRRSSSPLTARELAGEVVRQKFPTTSKDIPQLVKSQVSKLTAQGIFQHAKGRPGVILAGLPKGTSPSASTTRASKNGTKGGKPTPPSSVGKKLTLRALLTDLLTGVKEPVSVQELTRQVKATGYRSKSQDFRDVVWSMLGQMDNVENFPGQGYRLKRR